MFLSSHLFFDYWKAIHHERGECRCGIVDAVEINATGLLKPLARCQLCPQLCAIASKEAVGGLIEILADTGQSWSILILDPNRISVQCTRFHSTITLPLWPSKEKFQSQSGRPFKGFCPFILRLRDSRSTSDTRP